MSRINGFSKLTAAILLVALVAPVVSTAGQSGSPGKSLTEDQKIVHVLNRLGFGARPGDIERVKKIGIKKYIDQQLNPAGIDDAIADKKGG
jgi:hypothetical protein